MPKQLDEQALEQKKEAIRLNLQDCLETNEQGHVELKLKLANQEALENIAAALAKLTG